MYVWPRPICWGSEWTASESESDDLDSTLKLLMLWVKQEKLWWWRNILQFEDEQKRRAAKAVAEKHYLSRKVSKKISKVVQECPDIGKTIESYVQEHQVDADAQRCTGVLTFDGNTHLKNKATYEGIKQHLQTIYKQTFSYGTVVQLCIPRNKQRSSAKRYRWLTKVTSRRARQGFTLKLNPDAHWSPPFFKGLNELQYADGRDLLILNLHDATGFRLDTMTTCN